MTNLILCDLNYTLVANNDERPTGLSRDRFTEWIIEHERYNVWLLDWLDRARREGATLAIMTARPEHYETATHRALDDGYGWGPDASFFAPSNIRMTPDGHKKSLLDSRVYPEYGKDTGDFFAVESNSKTRRMYHAAGIRCVSPAVLDNIVSLT